MGEGHTLNTRADLRQFEVKAKAPGSQYQPVGECVDPATAVNKVDKFNTNHSDIGRARSVPCGPVQ